ncbi:phosphatase PAP2 family protein [Sphingomicrobium astaxanthinifaciens]|nr:phosphatase PAP2 family protein [Sphingomicrobium astaxanthinifaciens]MCJ7422314.1 phosphatase PAP2 family protein [Sphingomicrobium astaxanthinifaciens]
MLPALPRWLPLSALVVALTYGAALVIGWRHGYPYRLPFDAYFIAFMTIAVAVVLAGIVAKLAIYAWQREPRPLARLRAEPRRPVVVFVLLVGLMALELAALMWLKSMLPMVAGFWADPLLADLDAALFLGTDPWRLTHALLGWASPAFDWAYAAWGPVKTGCLLLIVFAPESPAKGRLILSYFLVISLTALVQYLLPSAGPVFWQLLGISDRFAELPYQPLVISGRDYLWADYQAGGGLPGTGISAMPSLHVALSLWVGLCVATYLPRAALLGWGYALVVMIGSVHLGWHYALDSLGAIIVVAASWAIARAAIAPVSREGAGRARPPRRPRRAG